VWLGWGQCVEHYGTGEPYLPVLDALGRLCRAPAGERIVAVLERCAPTWLAQLPALLSAEERERLQRQLVGSSRERMLREMADALEALSTERPLVLVLEDLQWSDHATIDLLSFLARRRPPARLLLLGVYRPVDVIVGDHPLKSLKQDLQAHGQCAELSLGFLTPDDVASYLTERFPVCPFSSDLAEVIHRRTDGNPLFMVNVVDYIRQQRLVVEHNGQWLLQGDVVEIETGVPENLRAMIAQQIDRLSHDEQRLLEAASAVGVRFSLAELAAALDKGAAEIEEQCERFARQGRFLRALGLRDWPDGAVAACYEFAHTIYQSMLHERLSLPQRMRLHQRIGDWIARAYGDRAAEVAAELAMHFEQGREYSRAIAALHQAAESAVRRCANREAASSLTKALTLLATLPDTPERARQELTLYTALGPILIASKGNAAPEVEQVYKRARDLCQQVGDTAQLFPIVFGLRSFYMMWGEIGFAHALGQELLQIAQKTDTPEFLLEAHVALASTYFFLGEFPACREHAEHGIALYQPRQHGAHVSLYGLDPGVFCLCRAGQVLWMLGRPEQGRERVFAALALARKLMHPYSLTFALLNTAWVLLFCRQGEKARAYVDEGLALANEHDFPFFLVWGSILRGWALTLQGRGKEGVAHIQQGLATPTPMADATRSYLLTLLAEACLSHGAPQEGLDVLAQVAETEQRSGERFLEAERCRLRGELLLQLAAPRRKMKVSRKPRGA
jgi:tetratricopeptide (TPR) repeat protein